MKKLSKSLLLVAVFACTTLPAWSQASTEGKEFWVSSSLVCSPDKATPTPYIAVSAEKACTVTIQGGIGNAINITQNVADGSWSEFGNTAKTEQKNPAAGPVCVNMDASKWYPTAMNDANNVSTLAAQKNMYGLHITATENVSVYVILSSKNSMDASNILPMTALGSEYYTQDYWSKVKSDFANAVGLTTILGTEDNTQIDITPNGDTFDGWTSGSTHQITLNKGQTYYLVTKKSDRLAGTHIMAKNGKKIAVYCGVPITNIPTGIAARDCLFEQSMPVEYWGTQFIVTRSLEKDGNLIGITATQDGTEIKVDGYVQASINEGETYYIMLQGAYDPNGNNAGESPINLVLTQDAAYIETSCPCAVYSYDTGNGYKGKNGTELVTIGGKDDYLGDPSSVWISPIQQKIGKITFGTCYTSKTKDHFLNVVTETATCQNTKLTAIYGATQLDKSSLLVWQPVPGNPTYSYARAKIGEASTSQFSVFRLENARGFTATIYGNGDDESYAYSAGSAAVEQGVKVNGNPEPFTNGYRSDKKYCFGEMMTFDANVGTDEITRVDWDFGDGVCENHGTPQTKHTYYSPGWYDVTASLYGHQICTDESEMPLGSIRFTFRIVKPDTVFGKIDPRCISLEDYKANPAQWDDSIAHPRIDTVQEHCYDDVVLNYVMYHRETEEIKDTIKGKDVAYGYNGKEYIVSQDVVDTVTHAKDTCYHFIRYYVKVIYCLDMSVTNNPAAQYACLGQNITVKYTKTKGDIDGKAILKVPGYADQEVDISNDTVTNANLVIPTGHITNPGTYKAQLLIKDENCGDTKTFDIDIAIYYPDSIFTYEFNNVLAVWQKGYGKNVNPGWDFIAYQWYRNDTLIEGATSSVYHTAEPFTLYDEYYVELTRRDGVTLRSCSQTIYAVDDFSGPEQEEPEPDSGEQPAPAAMPTKVIRNQQMHVLHDGAEYNMFGQRVR